MSAEFLIAVAACASALAACASAIATWWGPKSAAKLAEMMRRDAEDKEQKRRMKLWIFSTLMAERETYYNAEPSKALNLIDVAFVEDWAVRQAWASFFEALDPSKSATELEKKTRLRSLLQSMCMSLGLSEALTVDDINRTYYPAARAEMDRIQYHQRQEMLRNLDASPNRNVSP